mmetsp:Transcript_12043/g.11914  ORF Transcript_12043/g.11914 Transcript_12043/m.11914 type:complete len:98 (-) Transcript_12043:2211-2504(-)
MVIWASNKNLSVYLEEDIDTSYKNSELESWMDLRARFLMQMAYLDNKFPSSLRLNKVSKNVLGLGTHMISDTILSKSQNEDLFTKELKEDLIRLLEV